MSSYQEEFNKLTTKLQIIKTEEEKLLNNEIPLCIHTLRANGFGFKEFRTTDLELTDEERINITKKMDDTDTYLTWTQKQEIEIIMRKRLRLRIKPTRVYKTRFTVDEVSYKIKRGSELKTHTIANAEVIDFNNEDFMEWFNILPSYSNCNLIFAKKELAEKYVEDMIELYTSQIDKAIGFLKNEKKQMRRKIKYKTGGKNELIQEGKHN